MDETVVGLDIGGTQIKAGLVDRSGRVLRSHRITTPLDLHSLRDGLRALFSMIGADQKLAGVGVGCKGIIDPVSTRVDCQPGVMQYLEGSVLSDLVRDSLGNPEVLVSADNDARVALMGECVWGAARGKRDVLMLTLGTGVGGGILSDGRILRGHRGIAGHLGHLTLDPDGPFCICGNRGCLESIFSARVIEAEAFTAMHRGLVSSMPERPACSDVFTAAAGGDTVAQRVVSESVRKLGAGIAGLLHLLDPEIVIVGGQVSRAGESLFAPLRKEIAWRTRTLLRREVPVLPTEVDDSSGVVGAAALAFHN